MTNIIVEGYPYVGYFFCFILCSGGFKDLSLSYTIGYSTCVMCNVILTLCVKFDEIKQDMKYITSGQFYSHPGSYFRMIQLLLPFLFGARLFGFLMYRRWHKAYKTMHTKMKNRAKEAKMYMNVTAVVLNALIFSALVLPYYANFRTKEAKKPQVISIIGLCLMVFGFVVNATADIQKFIWKNKGGGLITHGLYRHVRHPNYAGEILFHFASILAGWHGYGSWWVGILSSLGDLTVAMIIFLSAKKCQRSQKARYSGTPGFDEYHARSWILVPFVW